MIKLYRYVFYEEKWEKNVLYELESETLHYHVILKEKRKLV